MSQISRIKGVRLSDLNDKKTLFGGKILAEMDVLGGMACMVHTQTPCYTIGVNGMRFHEPLFEGQKYIVDSFVSGVGNKSLETYCTIHRVNLKLEKEALIADGFFSFYPLLEEGQSIPKAIAKNEFEQSIIDGYALRRSNLTPKAKD